MIVDDIYYVLQTIRGRESFGIATACSEESETPRRRTAFGKGMAPSGKPTVRCKRSFRLATADATDRLRVAVSKSEDFTYSVTVRPRSPVLSQRRQTFAMNGASSAIIRQGWMGSRAVRGARPFGWTDRVGTVGFFGVGHRMHACRGGPRSCG